MGKKLPRGEVEQERSKNKQLSLLKRENHQLKQQISRLRKQLLKAIESGVLKDDTQNEEAVPKKQRGPTCTVCDSANIKSATLHSGKLVVCLDCGTRKRVE